MAFANQKQLDRTLWAIAHQFREAMDADELLDRNPLLNTDDVSISLNADKKSRKVED